jgi:hypothetical protein
MENKTEMEDKTRRRNKKQWLLQVIVVLAIAVLGLGGFTSAPARGEDVATSKMHFHDVKQQTREFHAYNQSITLTAEQRAVMDEALRGLPAPCCADRTAATCCCPCNMAMSWWGLSKYLIAERGYGSDQVREAVADWFRFINPDGFTGNACYTGGCNRPFHENGCGGMNKKNVIF